MRRFVTLSSLAALVGLAFGAVAVDAAPQARPVTPVEVVNADTSPVPVLGEVTVGNTNPLPISGDVVVANTSPVPVVGEVVISNTTPLAVEVTNASGTPNRYSDQAVFHVIPSSGTEAVLLPFGIVLTDLVVTTIPEDDPDCRVSLGTAEDGGTTYWVGDGNSEFHLATGIAPQDGYAFGILYWSSGIENGYCHGRIFWTGYSSS